MMTVKIPSISGIAASLGEDFAAFSIVRPIMSLMPPIITESEINIVMPMKIHPHPRVRAKGRAQRR